MDIRNLKPLAKRYNGQSRVLSQGFMIFKQGIIYEQISDFPRSLFYREYRNERGVLIVNL